ncbi:hypothetical protein [Sinimarinibacterium sp. CAU 1509]|uniref:hypothetical protein n=1 Tax=Sinimarinibacterium sp. CAU 1509 TaxID=2562283 RepID=UPI001B7F7CF9|nr:hypothetical protein [Sinimarinibacterium sp. CAU 1509]
MIAALLLGALGVFVCGGAYLSAATADRYTFTASKLGALGPIAENPPPIHLVRMTVDQLLQQHGKMLFHLPIAEVDWSQQLGKWTVLVFVDLPDSGSSHRLSGHDAWAIGNWLAAIRHAMNEQTPGAELWLTRMDLPGGFNGRVMGLAQFTKGCFMYSAGCFDRFLVGFTDPGADGTYFLPQVDWLLEVHGSRIDEAHRNSLGYPLMMLVRPDGEMVAVTRDSMTSLQVPGSEEFITFLKSTIAGYDKEHAND